MNNKILVVDDEASVRKLVTSYLKKEGFQVTEAADGTSAIAAARKEHPDLIVLDLMIPGVDGIEVTRTLRAESDVFIIILSARTEETDKLIGLGIGADDYLTKPFSPRELVARIKAILRRGKEAAPQEIVQAGDIVIDRGRHQVSVAGRELDLTPREFEILDTLTTRPGMVFTRESLLEQVWGYNYFGDARVVDVHIAKLRKKLSRDAGGGYYIRTVRGVGYKLVTGE